MTIETKFIIVTFLVALSQLPLLILLGKVKRYLDPKNRFFSTAYFCLIIIIVLDFFYFNISYKVLLSSLLIILSSIFILFTFWSILVWGFTTSMLVSLNKKKGYKITKEKWIRVYCNNQNLNTFTKDRIQLLYLINVIKKQNKNVTITANGYIISFLYKILKNFFV